MRQISTRGHRRPQAVARAIAQAAALLAAAAAAQAQEAPNVRVSVVESTSDATVLRIIVADPKLETVSTPAGRFERFAQRGTSIGGADASRIGQPELPVAGFSLALPLDGERTVVDVKPEGEAQTLSARL